MVARNDASRLAPTSRDASPKDSPRAYVAATTSSPPRASPEAPARLTNASNAPLRTTYAASPGVPCWRNTSFARTLTRRAPRASTARISAAVSVRNAGDAARRAGKSRSRAPRTLRRRVTVPSARTFSTTSASSSAAPAAPVLAARNAASPPAASAFSSRRRRTFASTVSPARVHADDPTKKCDAALSAARRAIRNDIVASEPSSSSTTPRVFVPNVRRTRSRANRSARSSNAVGRRSTTARNAFFGISIARARGGAFRDADATTVASGFAPVNNASSHATSPGSSVATRLLRGTRPSVARNASARPSVMTYAAEGSSGSFSNANGGSSPPFATTTCRAPAATTWRISVLVSALNHRQWPKRSHSATPAGSSVGVPSGPVPRSSGGSPAPRAPHGRAHGNVASSRASYKPPGRPRPTPRADALTRNSVDANRASRSSSDNASNAPSKTPRRRRSVSARNRDSRADISGGSARRRASCAASAAVSASAMDAFVAAMDRDGSSMDRAARRASAAARRRFAACSFARLASSSASTAANAARGTSITHVSGDFATSVCSRGAPVRRHSRPTHAAAPCLSARSVARADSETELFVVPAFVSPPPLERRFNAASASARRIAPDTTSPIAVVVSRASRRSFRVSPRSSPPGASSSGTRIWHLPSTTMTAWSASSPREYTTSPRLTRWRRHSRASVHRSRNGMTRNASTSWIHRNSASSSRRFFSAAADTVASNASRLAKPAAVSLGSRAPRIFDEMAAPQRVRARAAAAAFRASARDANNSSISETRRENASCDAYAAARVDADAGDSASECRRRGRARARRVRSRACRAAAFASASGSLVASSAERIVRPTSTPKNAPAATPPPSDGGASRERPRRARNARQRGDDDRARASNWSGASSNAACTSARCDVRPAALASSTRRRTSGSSGFPAKSTTVAPDATSVAPRSDGIFRIRLRSARNTLSPDQRRDSLAGRSRVSATVSPSPRRSRPTRSASASRAGPPARLRGSRAISLSPTRSSTKDAHSARTSISTSALCDASSVSNASAPASPEGRRRSAFSAARSARSLGCCAPAETRTRDVKRQHRDGSCSSSRVHLRVCRVASSSSSRVARWKKKTGPDASLSPDSRDAPPSASGSSRSLLAPTSRSTSPAAASSPRERVVRPHPLAHTPRSDG